MSGDAASADPLLQVLVYGDCAVNVEPTAEELAQIAIVSADTATAFGIAPPRLAMLSYSTGTSGAGPQVRGGRLLRVAPGVGAAGGGR